MQYASQYLGKRSDTLANIIVIYEYGCYINVKVCMYHGHGLKFKCSLCNIFIYVIVAKGRTYIICTDNILLIYLMIID